jgi:hypothetical protein
VECNLMPDDSPAHVDFYFGIEGYANAYCRQ